MNQLTQDEKNAIHEAFRNDVVSRLKRLSQITTEDLLPLDRIGCVLIIDSAWEKYSKKTRDSFLCHEDRLIREAAALRSVDADYHGDSVHLSAEKICSLMQKHKLAIHELAARMSISVRRVRYVREHGVSGRIRCYAWLEAIKGGKAFQKTSS